MFRQEISPSSNFSLQISNFGNIGGSQNGWEFQDLALEFCISTKPAGNSLPRARVTAVFWSAPADSSPPPGAPVPTHLSGDSKRNGKIRHSRRTRCQAAAGEIWRVLEISMEKWYTSISLWCLLFIILYRIKNLSTLFFKADFFFRLKSFPAFQFCYKCDNKRQNLPEQRCWCKLSLYVFKYYVLDMTIPNPLS